MAGKIFYRRKLHDREDTTELVVVAVHETDLKIFHKHLYMKELMVIAEAAGADLVELPAGPRHEHGYHGEEDIEAKSAI